ncbi:MAG: peptidoglycan-binding protein [Candidatus Scalindua sp.]|nr:peptidoglycan-binding protein [Candidatus Scalindua sp.]
MRLQGRNLEPNMRGDDVKLLQDALRQLDFNISDTQRFFGAETLAAVRKFQREQGIEPADGIVNNKTAERITKMLAVREGPQPNVVSGRILNAEGKGVPDRLVRLFFVKLDEEQQLGSDTTDDHGAYAIKYVLEEDSVNLQVRVFDSTRPKTSEVYQPHTYS